MKKIVAVIALYILGQMAGSAHAVILMGTGNVAANTTAPTAGEFAGDLLNSGWQFQGQIGNFLGTPIAPNYFITAGHLPFPIGTTINYDSNVYTTDAMYDDPASDLRIYRVTTPFSSYAPLYTNTNEVGKQLVVFGRGTQRGPVVLNNSSQPAGWEWGTADNVQRWGTNTVSGTATGSPSQGQFLVANFTFSGNASSTEAMLSVGDSGGAVFIQDGGIWKLAGINYGTDGHYSLASDGSNSFDAALYNQNGLYRRISQGPDVYAAAPNAAGNFYSSRISTNMDFINDVLVPEPSTVTLMAVGAAMAMWGTVRRRNRNAA